MREILHWMVRLYPATWRNRYEQEFHAVLDDMTPRVKDLLDVVRQALVMRFTRGVWGRSLAFGVAAALLSLLTLRWMPVTYDASALLSIRLTGAEPLRTMIERTLTREHLLPVIEKFHLYGELRSSHETDRAVERMRQHITLLRPFPRTAPRLASLSFQDSDRRVVADVTRDLVTLLVKENRRGMYIEVIGAPVEGRQQGPDPVTVAGVVLVEGIQIGLIVALFRRRETVAVQPASANAK